MRALVYTGISLLYFPEGVLLSLAFLSFGQFFFNPSKTGFPHPTTTKPNNLWVFEAHEAVFSILMLQST